MARRRRRHYRGYGRHRRGSRFGDLSIGKVARSHVSVKDASIGALVGLGAGLGAIYGLNKLNASRALQGKPALGFTVTAGQTVPAAWLPFVPALGGLAVGLAAHFAMKKKRGKGVAVLAGSVIGGLIVSGFQFAKAKWPTMFGDYVKVRLAGYGNVLVNQGALGNLLVTMPVGPAAGAGQFPAGRRASMGQLALAAMSPAARATAGYMRARF